MTVFIIIIIIIIPPLKFGSILFFRTIKLLVQWISVAACCCCCFFAPRKFELVRLLFKVISVSVKGCRWVFLWNNNIALNSLVKIQTIEGQCFRLVFTVIHLATHFPVLKTGYFFFVLYVCLFFLFIITLSAFHSSKKIIHIKRK